MRNFAALRKLLSNLSLRKAGAGVARARIILLLLVFACVYGVIGARLVYLGIAPETAASKARAAEATAQARPDVFDRKGRLIATDVRTPSLFAEPQRIIDVDEATDLLLKTLPDLDRSELRARLPGYLVPRLVREIAGAAAKTPV